jgi:hypothetical protein
MSIETPLPYPLATYEQIERCAARSIDFFISML